MEKDEEIKEQTTTKKRVRKTNETNNGNERTCHKCGNSIPTGAKYCIKCGTKVLPLRKVMPKKEKEPLNQSLVVILAIILTVLVSFGSFYIYINYFYNGVIDNSNRHVTVDDTGIADSVEKVYNSVVVVENYIDGKLYGSGSGFVYKTDTKSGYILTNSHVVSNATSLKVLFTNGESTKADVVGNDEYSDVALLKVDKKYVSQTAIIGDNKQMRIGDTTFAIGAPLDSSTYSWSVTRGILSGKDRVVSTGSSYMNVLQTDTPINSGNSGGPLCNANGEVIGITNMKLASEQIEGMGFAIPIETAVEYASKFINGEDLKRPYVGVSIYDASQSFFSQETKVVVAGVEKDSPAEKAGIKEGDIITKIGKDKVTDSSFFRYKLYSYKIGDKVKIEVERNGQTKTIEVTLGTNSKTA